MNQLALTIETLPQAIEAVLKANKVPLAKGPPGLGKSIIHKMIADKYRLKLIDIRAAQCEPPDFLGFPYGDVQSGKSGYLPIDTFPLEGDSVPEGYDGWLVFFDEVTSASDEVQAAIYKIILDRTVNQSKMHERCMIAAAGNDIDHGAIAYEMSSALRSRFVHLHVKSNYKAYANVMLKLNMDHRIKSFLAFRPGKTNNFDPDKLGLEDTYACERTWHFLSDIMKHTAPEDSLALPIYAGTIGEGTAREFIGFCKVYHSLPPMNEILSSPQTARVPEEPGHLYAMTGSLADHADRSNIEPIMEYVCRLPLDFQVVAIRQIVFHDRSMMYDVPPITRWIENNSVELF